MMQRDRKREGLRVCRAAWLIGVSVREYREIGGVIVICGLITTALPLGTPQDTFHDLVRTASNPVDTSHSLHGVLG